MRKELLVVMLILKSATCFAQGDICSELDELSTVKVEQSRLSQFLFGVNRGEDEINWVTKVQNSILTGKTDEDFYIYSQKCVSQLQQNENFISVERNLKIIEIDLLYGLGNSTEKRFSSNEYSDIYKFLIGNINTGDYVLSASVIRALGIFSTEQAAETLFLFILNENNRAISRKNAAKSLAFINSDYSRKKITELERLSKWVQW